LATNPQFSSYTPVPFTISLPRRKEPEFVREIPSTIGGDGFRVQTNENFKRLQREVTELRTWQDLTSDYRNGPLGVLNLHADVDYAIPPREGDVLAWVNNQWTNLNLTSFGNIELLPQRLNQLTDVEAVNNAPGKVLIYDPATALVQQNALRNGGATNYDDGAVIPPQNQLQATNPNAPNFVQPWISRYLQLSDLLDVSSGLSSIGSNFRLFYFDPTDTSKSVLGKTTNGLWKSLATPVGGEDSYLGANTSGQIVWKTLPTLSQSLLDLDDVLPSSNTAIFGDATCSNPNILEFGSTYGFNIQNTINGVRYVLKKLNANTKYKVSGERITVCSGEQYIVKRKLVLVNGSSITLEPESYLQII
jgi:hypothetical protein